MASNYPSSLDSYSTKASSDTISEGHINDPQDAIEALEAKVGIAASTPVADKILKGTGTGTSSWSFGGRIIQMVHVQDGNYVLYAEAAFPEDDTIPQISEGAECMTLAITPKAATNILKIDVVWNGAAEDVQGTCVALFNTDNHATNALACASNYVAGTDHLMSVSFTYYVAAGTTSATTFRVRAGNTTAAKDIYFNGDNYLGSLGQVYGGVLASTITITEIAADV